MRMRKRLPLLIKHIYFIFFMFLFMTRPVHAYIDPSVMTYAIQAVAGVAIGLGTVFGLYWRRMKNALFKNSKWANRNRKTEPDEILFEENDEEALTRLQEVRMMKAQAVPESETKKKTLKVSFAWMDRLTEFVPVIALFVVTFGIFMPSTLFLGNIDEFLVGYEQVLPILEKYAVIALAISIGLSIVMNDFACHLLSAVCFAFTICLYVQGNFLNPVLPSFNGMAVDWSRFAESTKTSTVFWTAMMIAFPVLALIFRKTSKVIIRLVCFILCATQIVTLTYMDRTTVSTKNKDYYITKNNEFDLSASKNTVVILVDTLDAVWFENNFAWDEYYSQQLKDFTFFNNAVAGAAPTSLGVPYMLTGVEYDPAWSMDDYWKHAYEESTMIDDFAKAGVRTRIFTGDMDFIKYANFDEIDNVIPLEYSYSITSEEGFARGLYQIAAYFAAPMKWKKYFELSNNPLTQYTGITTTENGEQYVTNDPQFYQDFVNSGIHPVYDEPTFTFYHLFGAHGPYTMNENAEYEEMESSTENHLRQMQGCMKICFEIIENMKEQGIYDSSTIIITADHGGVQYFQNPTILVKMPDTEQDDLIINSAPVTFDNLYNTFAKSLLGEDDQRYGETLFDVDPYEVRTRRHAVNSVNVTRITFPDEPVFQESSISVITFYGDARDIWNVSYSLEDSYVSKK